MNCDEFFLIRRCFRWLGKLVFMPEAWAWNPNGVLPSSPRLPESARATLGLDKQVSPTPTGLWPLAYLIGPKSRWGCGLLSSSAQGSPRGLGQPWAGGHNAVDVEQVLVSHRSHRKQRGTNFFLSSKTAATREKKVGRSPTPKRPAICFLSYPKTPARREK